MSYTSIVFIPGERVGETLPEQPQDKPVVLGEYTGFLYTEEIMEKFPNGKAVQAEGMNGVTLFYPDGVIPRKPVTFVSWPNTGIRSDLAKLGEFVLATTEEPEGDFDVIVHMPKITSSFPPPYSINGTPGSFDFSPPTEGEVLYCKEGWPVVSKVGNIVRFHVYTDDEAVLLTLLNIAITGSSVDPTKVAAEYLIRGQRDKVAMLERQFKDWENKAETLRKQFQQAITNREQASFEHHALQVQVDQLDPVTVISDALESIRKLDKISSVELLGTSIVAHCPGLTFEGPNTGKRKLGDVDIILPLNREEYVRFHNRTRRIEGFGSWGECHHPHVRSNGKACFGDFEGPIEEARAMSDFATAMSVCVLFLESVNPEDSAGAYYKKWPKCAK